MPSFCSFVVSRCRELTTPDLNLVEIFLGIACFAAKAIKQLPHISPSTTFGIKESA